MTVLLKRMRPGILPPRANATGTPHRRRAGIRRYAIDGKPFGGILRSDHTSRSVDDWCPRVDLAVEASLARLAWEDRRQIADPKYGFQRRKRIDFPKHPSCSPIVVAANLTIEVTCRPLNRGRTIPPSGVVAKRERLHNRAVDRKRNAARARERTGETHDQD